ncbi:DUF222 domain-containing protein, partial [Kineosporia babensis]|nr:DUF222 domain-containing protein [Kineosporia babensis]
MPVNLESLSDPDLLKAVLESELILRQVASRQAEAIALMVSRTAPARRGRPRPGRSTDPGAPDPDEGGDSENGAGEGNAGDDQDGAEQIGSRTMVVHRLAPELTRNPQRMHHVVATACHLSENLPAVMALVKSGRLDWERAELIARRMHNPAPGLEWFKPGCEEWAIVQSAIVVRAPSLAYPQLKELIRRLLEGLRPADTNERHRQANDARRVWTEILPDGMAALGANLPADKVQIIDGVLDALADADRDAARAEGRSDSRTQHQRRADALIAVFGALAAGIDVPLARDPRQFAQDDSADSADAVSSVAPASEPPRHPAGASGPPGSSRSNAETGGTEAGRTEADGIETSGAETGGAEVRGAETGGARTGGAEARGTETGGSLADGGGEAECSSCARRDLIDRLERAAQAQEEADRRSLSGFGLNAVPVGHIPAFWELSKVPQRSGRQTLAVVTLTDQTLKGRSETLGYLQGYGAISADQARRIASQATSVVLLPVSPAQHPEHTSPQANRYRPSSDLARQVIARYQTCTYPNCLRPAATCD